MKVVFDTNILFSAVGWRGSPYECVQRARRGDFQLILCDEILEELHGKLRTKRALSKASASRIVDEIRLIATMVEIEGAMRNITSDPDDDMVVECAAAGKAAFIVSGDRHLLTLGAYETIRIIRASEFLKILGRLRLP